MRYLILVLQSLSLSVFAAETVIITEESLPQLVEERNGRVAGERSRVDAAKAEQGFLKRSFIPQLELAVGSEQTDGRPSSSVSNSYTYTAATANLNLFNGGRDSLREKAREQRTEEARAQLTSSRFSVLTQVRILYWQLLYQKEVVTILESAMKLNDENLRSAQKKIRNNLATKTDEIDFEQTKIQLSQDLRRSQIVLSNIRRDLASLLNHPLDTVYETKTLNLHPENHQLDEFRKRQFTGQEHREIKALQAQRQALESEEKINARWWTPRFDLYASKFRLSERLTQTNQMDRDQGEVLGARFSFSFDGFEQRAQATATEYRVSALEHQRTQREQELQAGYANAYQLYELNHDLIHSAEENNKMAQKYYDSVWSEYMRGIKNSPDVLQAFLRIVEAKIRYADIKKDYQIARTEIMGYLEE